MEAESDDEIRVYLGTDEGENLLYATGYCKPVSFMTVQDKHSVASVLLDYHLMVKVKAEMDQFKAGLSTLWFLELLQSNPEIWEPYLMAIGEPFNAGTKAMYKLAHVGMQGWVLHVLLFAYYIPEFLEHMLRIEFSEKGSNARKREEQAYIHFCDFLNECDEGVHLFKFCC